MLYHQSMTPLWLEAHASYIDSSRTVSAKQLTFNAGSVAQAALLKVPMIAAGCLKYSTPLTLDITVAHDVSIGQGTDSDPRYGVSDVPDLSDLKRTTRGIMATVLLGMEWKARPAPL